MDAQLAVIPYVVGLAGALLGLDHAAHTFAAQDVATAGALRAARAVVAGLDEEQRLLPGTEDRARSQAALAMVPLVPADGPSAPGTAGLTGGAQRLAQELDLRLRGDLEGALGRTRVVVQVGAGGAWRTVHDGDDVSDADGVRVVVGWLHTYRADPAALLFRSDVDGYGFGGGAFAAAAPARVIEAVATLPLSTVPR